MNSFLKTFVASKQEIQESSLLEILIFIKKTPCHIKRLLLSSFFRKYKEIAIHVTMFKNPPIGNFRSKI